MKRRSFFSTVAVGSLGLTACNSVGEKSDNQIAKNSGKKNWNALGRGQMQSPVRQKDLSADVVVIGGGITGICAAVSAAREGAKVVLVQDRGVLGGNASSEIRVNINGVNGLRSTKKPERETGIIEEILIKNRFENPKDSYEVFDDVLYDFVMCEPNITLLLHTSAIDAVVESSEIKKAICFQPNTQTKIVISAKFFIDCSGDGELAARAGALFRTGREGKAEFNEKYAPDQPDGWQMGCSLQFISKDMGKPVKFTPPSYTIKYNEDDIHPKRKIKQVKFGQWWLEIGSDFDIVGDYNLIHRKLKGYLYGVWDYIKNSGNFPEAENYALDWVGSLPGRRESRRFEGDYMLKEGDMLGYKHFFDAVGYGGWSLDEHNPGGIENTKEEPSYFHAYFVKVYEIPFGSLYSKNISNLFFAGRNISQTHIALSSTRVIATLATLGQAVGTASGLCLKYGITPRKLRDEKMDILQETLLRNDSFIPNRPSKCTANLAKKASLKPSSTMSGDVNNLVNGTDRDFDGKINHWQAKGKNAILELNWDKPQKISQVDIKSDSNTQTILAHRWMEVYTGHQRNFVPPEMLKSFAIEAKINGEWKTVFQKDDIKTRLTKAKFDSVTTDSIRLILKETYGEDNIRLYDVRAYS